MQEIDEIILRRLKSLSVRLGESHTEVPWIQFCEIVVIATLLHQKGFLTDEALGQVIRLEESLVKKIATAKTKGRCEDLPETGTG